MYRYDCMCLIKIMLQINRLGFFDIVKAIEILTENSWIGTANFVVNDASTGVRLCSVIIITLSYTPM